MPAWTSDEKFITACMHNEWDSNLSCSVQDEVHVMNGKKIVDLYP